MAKKQSAGLLVYRRNRGAIEVLLVHPGGPFWAKKDLGAWSIPKGELEPSEDPLDAAKREFREETGAEVTGIFRALSPVKQKSGKTVHAFAVESDLDASAIESNSFSMEWPPKSGRMEEFPEADRAAWYALDEARAKIHPAQAVLLTELEGFLTGKC